jgi:hypothetical protein
LFWLHAQGKSEQSDLGLISFAGQPKKTGFLAF